MFFLQLILSASNKMVSNEKRPVQIHMNNFGSHPSLHVSSEISIETRENPAITTQPKNCVNLKQEHILSSESGYSSSFWINWLFYCSSRSRPSCYWMRSYMEEGLVIVFLPSCLSSVSVYWSSSLFSWLIASYWERLLKPLWLLKYFSLIFDY